MIYQPDQSQLNALKTWYSKDNPLHLDPRHPAIKLAGEAGELTDLFGKHEYKPNFSWWNCKHCKRPQEVHHRILATHDGCQNYTPLILDELGDYSYYLRILAYQKGVSFEEICKNFNPAWYYRDEDILDLLAELLDDSSKVLNHFLGDKEVSLPTLANCIYGFLAILSKLDTTLDVVLDLNYKKLNSEPSNHGWRSAKMKTIDDCPPMNPK